MISFNTLRGVPVGGSRKLKLRAIAQQATQQRRDLMHEMPPLEEKNRTRHSTDGRIGR